MSDAKPTGWNVVVTGAWNLAILTPSGIAGRLFGLAPSAAVEIEVAMDRPGSFRVIHDGVSVDPNDGRLLVAPRDSTFSALEKAAKVAIRALADLPVTPVGAAGVNFRYALDSIPDPLRDLLAAKLERELSNEGYTIVQHFSRKTMAFRDGLINVELLHEADGPGTVVFNFHRASAAHAELSSWLAQVETMDAETRKLCSILKISLGQEAD